MTCTVEVPDAALVYTDGPAGIAYMERAKDVVRCSAAFDEVAEAALDIQQSRELIISTIETAAP